MQDRDGAGVVLGELRTRFPKLVHQVKESCRQIAGPASGNRETFR
jgi:hypothetical protein